MDTYKLRIRIGANEFEAEGPQDVVKAQFEEFKALINIKPSQGTKPTPEAFGVPAISDAEPTFVNEKSSVLFDQDRKRGLISLKIPPKGDKRVEDAVLLILLGYRLLRNEQEVPVTKLKAALIQSGIRVDRIDRKTVHYVHEGLIIKTGMSKGGRYRLTNNGKTKADELMTNLLAQVA